MPLSELQTRIEKRMLQAHIVALLIPTQSIINNAYGKGVGDFFAGRVIHKEAQERFIFTWYYWQLEAKSDLHQLKEKVAAILKTLYDDIKPEYQLNGTECKRHHAWMASHYLINAIRNDDDELLEIALAAGGNPNINSGGRTALTDAIQHGAETKIARLLEHPDIDVNVKVSYGYNKTTTALFIAISHRNISLVKQLLDKNANLNIIPHKNILVYAINSNASIELIQLLRAYA